MAPNDPRSTIDSTILIEGLKLNVYMSYDQTQVTAFWQKLPFDPVTLGWSYTPQNR